MLEGKAACWEVYFSLGTSRSLSLGAGISTNSLGGRTAEYRGYLVIRYLFGLFLVLNQFQVCPF